MKNIYLNGIIIRAINPGLLRNPECQRMFVTSAKKHIMYSTNHFSMPGVLTASTMNESFAWYLFLYEGSLLIFEDNPADPG